MSGTPARHCDGLANTDAARETADVALMADNLGKLTEATLGRRAVRSIQTNIAFSVLFERVLVAAGIITMSMAVAADIVGNALRLVRTS